MKHLSAFRPLSRYRNRPLPQQAFCRLISDVRGSAGPVRPQFLTCEVLRAFQSEHARLMASRDNSLFDDAAEESDDQQEEEENEQDDTEKQPKERSGSQAGSDVDSSDEEEGGNEYDMTDKFIAPEDEVDAGESESDEEGGRRKKKKRRRREDEELDEEDYALLEEQGVRVDVCFQTLACLALCSHTHDRCISQCARHLLWQVKSQTNLLMRF